jgi:hypothetical protein
MARTRDLKPGFFTNEDLAQLPPLARLLFQGLWCHADREGRLEDRPARLKVQILPYDDCDADDLLNKLASAGFIRRYQVDFAKFIQVVTFTDHQKPHPKEQVSEIPPPPERRAAERNGEPRKETASRESPEQAAEGFSRGVATSPSGSFPSSPSGDPTLSHSESASPGARVRDPGAPDHGADATATPLRPPSRADINAHWVMGKFRDVRQGVLKDRCLPWVAAGGALFQKAEQMALQIRDDTTAIADVEPTMRMVIERAQESQDPEDSKIPVMFGRWVSTFTDLREEHRGLRKRPQGAPARASPPASQPGLCAFHQPATTANRKAPRHDPECSECRHVAARDRPKTDTEPEPAFGGAR